MTQHTTDLKYQIERILDWEPSSHWRPRDFVQLSERIYAYTHKHVEAQDLQIFWLTSEVRSTRLLDALACFADYADWDDFYARNAYGIVELEDGSSLTHPPMWEIPMKWVIVICWFSVLASVIVAFLLMWKR